MMSKDSDKIKQAFANVLRDKRKALGYSQEELASRAGIAMRYVSLLETNKRQPTISTLYALAKALSLSLSELMNQIEAELSKK